MSSLVRNLPWILLFSASSRPLWESFREAISSGAPLVNILSSYFPQYTTANAIFQAVTNALRLTDKEVADAFASSSDDAKMLAKAIETITDPTTINNISKVIQAVGAGRSLKEIHEALPDIRIDTLFKLLRGEVNAVQLWGEVINPNEVPIKPINTKEHIGIKLFRSAAIAFTESGRAGKRVENKNYSPTFGRVGW
jgi:hypothetical protein